MDGIVNQPVPLRAVYPKLYDVLVAKLEDENLHAYDAKAVIIREEAQATVAVFSGNNYERSVEENFQLSQLESLNDKVITFIETAVAACKDAVQEDYRVFMKVQP